VHRNPYETPGPNPRYRRPRRRFTGLLIVQQVAVILVVYLAVIGLTHFRVEALAAAAALATFTLAFIRHVAETRAARSQSGRNEPVRNDPTRNEQAHARAAGQARTVSRMGLRDPGPWGGPGPADQGCEVPPDAGPYEQHAVTIAVSVTIVHDEAR
jgi:hypothetical protein